MFSWVQKKLLNGRSRNKKPSSIPPPADQNLGTTQREEFSDWPNAFLAIGTFGLKSVKEDGLQQPGNSNTAAVEDEVVEHTASSAPTTIISTVQQSKDSAAVMAKKSLPSYLLNKFFVCGGRGFAGGPPPLNRGPVLLHSESTRMDKILRKILEKKVHPQGTFAVSATKCLKSSTYDDDDHEDEDDDEAHAHPHPHHKAVQDVAKWVKTDIDYIVLEV